MPRDLGTGAIHLLNGLYDAKMDHQPVVAIVGQQARAAPPLPPHMTWEQAKALASSVWAGDADALGFIKQTVKDAIDSVLPHKK